MTLEKDLAQFKLRVGCRDNLRTPLDSDPRLWTRTPRFTGCCCPRRARILSLWVRARTAGVGWRHRARTEL